MSNTTFIHFFHYKMLLENLDCGRVSRRGHPVPGSARSLHVKCTCLRSSPGLAGLFSTRSSTEADKPVSVRVAEARPRKGDPALGPQNSNVKSSITYYWILKFFGNCYERNRNFALSLVYFGTINIELFRFALIKMILPLNRFASKKCFYLIKQFASLR